MQTIKCTKCGSPVALHRAYYWQYRYFCCRTHAVEFINLSPGALIEKERPE